MRGVSDLLAGSQITGARACQEDAFQLVAVRAADRDVCDLLLVLADGMGGHRGGAKASNLAVSTFVSKFTEAGGGVTGRLRESLDVANAAVGRYAANHADFAEMGCTLVACTVTHDERLYWISVGDSILWRLRNGTMERLNADHSMRPVLEDLVRLGRMTAEELRQDRSANQLRSAVTGEELSLVDEGETSIGPEAEDLILVTSDGVTTVPADEICALCAGRTPADKVVSKLLRAVERKAAPGQDNATVVAYRHVAASAVGRRLERLEAPTRPMRRRG